MWDLLFAFAAWYLCGVVGFLYWWAADGLDRPVVLEALGFGLLGPVTVLGGGLVHTLVRAEQQRRLKPIPIRIDERRRPRR